MGPSDDYLGEMDRLSSQDADEVLAGRRSGSGAARVAGAAADRLRQELLVPPAPAVAERHLAAMRAAVSRPGIQGGNPMQRKTRNRFASLGLAAALVLGAGIAGALTLPDQAADRAKEQTADVEAPKGLGNQGGNIQSSEHGQTVSEIARDDSTEGCEHGRAVSDAASSKSEGNKPGDAGNPDPCAQGNGGGTASAGKAKGHQKTHGSNAGSSITGNNGKSDEPHGQGSVATTDRGTGGPPEIRGASAGHAKSGK